MEKDFIKLIQALEDAIAGRFSRTDILYHLKNHFPEKDVKRLFNKYFGEYIQFKENKNKEEKEDKNKKLINVTNSSYDGRQKEYRLDGLNSLYKKNVFICKSKGLNKCEENILKIITYALVKNLFLYEEKILEKIENELDTFFGTKKPEKEKDIMSFYSPFNVKKSINEELLEEIRLIQTLIREFINERIG